MNWVSKLFNRMRKPKQELLAFGTVMLGWHPAVGIGLYDPLAGRHLSHQAGSSVILNHEPPPKLPREYTHVGDDVRSSLPSHWRRVIKVAYSKTTSPEGESQRYEVTGPFPDPFIYERITLADGTIRVNASCGSPSTSHEGQSPHVAAYVKHRQALEAARLAKASKGRDSKFG